MLSYVINTYFLCNRYEDRFWVVLCEGCIIFQTMINQLMYNNWTRNTHARVMPIYQKDSEQE